MYASFALIKFKIMVQFCSRQEKSLRHIAMVQCSKSFGWQQTRKSHSKVYSDYFKLHRSYSISLKFGKSWRKFLWDHIYRYLSLEKESDNVCVLFAYSIKRAREIRKFRSFIDIAVQRRQRNAKKIAWCTCKVVC